MSEGGRGSQPHDAIEAPTMIFFFFLCAPSGHLHGPSSGDRLKSLFTLPKLTDYYLYIGAPQGSR